MKKLLFTLSLSLSLMALTQLSAQVKTPAPSPLCKVTQNVGLSEVTIEYSRPGVKDRSIFGGLVPYGEIWRTGANAATKITFSDDVWFGGEKLAAGSYSFYTIPRADKWDIIFHTNTSYWGSGGDEYDAAGEALRLTATPFTIEGKIESMMIGLDQLRDASAELFILWDNIYVGIPFELGTHEKVMASIESTMNGPSANDYFAAGRYLYESESDKAKAYEYVAKATSMRDDAFWMYRLQSQIEASMGDYKKAIQTAQKSKDLAMKAGNSQYVKYNEESIAEWSKM